jgi:hypothetical protein
VYRYLHVLPAHILKDFPEGQGSYIRRDVTETWQDPSAEYVIESAQSQDQDAKDDGGYR